MDEQAPFLLLVGTDGPICSAGDRAGHRRHVLTGNCRDIAAASLQAAPDLMSTTGRPSRSPRILLLNSKMSPRNCRASGCPLHAEEPQDRSPTNQPFACAMRQFGITSAWRPMQKAEGRRHRRLFRALLAPHRELGSDELQIHASSDRLGREVVECRSVKWRCSEVLNCARPSGDGSGGEASSSRKRSRWASSARSRRGRSARRSCSIRDGSDPSRSLSFVIAGLDPAIHGPPGQARR
jgi:hypothetical protein